MFFFLVGNLFTKCWTSLSSSLGKRAWVKGGSNFDFEWSARIVPVQTTLLFNLPRRTEQFSSDHPPDALPVQSEILSSAAGVTLTLLARPVPVEEKHLKHFSLGRAGWRRARQVRPVIGGCN